jgi:hypothetical protein
MAALAVDEHQYLVGPEAAQRRRPDRVRPVGDSRPRKVEGRRDRLDHLRGLGVPAGRDLILSDDVDRDRLLGLGAG